MMAVAFALLAANCVMLWRRKARWGPAVAMAALIIGVIIFARDVDFSTNLGIQL